MANISFLNKKFETERERDSYVFQNKNTLLTQRKYTIAGPLVYGFIIGVVLSGIEHSSLAFLLGLIGTPILLNIEQYFDQKKIEEYSNKHKHFLIKLEKEVRKDIIEPYNQRYFTEEETEEHLSDLVNLINHKKKTNITAEDGIFLLSLSEKEHSIELLDKEVSELKDKSPKIFAKILIELSPEIDFEDEEDYKSILEYFCEYIGRENINCDIEELKQELISQYKMQKAKEFEEKLSRNHDDKISVEQIEHLDGFEFEQLIGELYRKAGYKVKVTKKSGDQGADIIVEKDGISTAIQTKKYGGSVGNKAVQEIVAAMKFYDCDKAMVITTGYFTKSAYELASKNKVKLIDRKALDELFDSIL